MKIQAVISSKHLSILPGLLAVFGLYLTGLYGYLLFHSLAELFSIVIACAIFIIVWNSRAFIETGYFLVIGVAYLSVSGIDLLHTLAYQGMGVFTTYDANLPTQLWIAARYLESLSLLIALLFVQRKVKLRVVILGYSFAVCLLLVLIFGRMFPDCYIEGVGLTPVKKLSEYVIILILGMSLVLLKQKRRDFDPGVFTYLIWSIVLTMGAELAFTFYISVYGISNMVGHFFKLFSFYYIYKALVVTSLTRPFQSLFRELTQREEALRRSEQNLRQNEARYKKAQEIGHVGNWEYDLNTTHFWGSEEARRLYGFSSQADDFSTEEVESCIPERERVHQALIDLIEHETPYDLEFEIHPKGSREPIIISSKAELLRDEHGSPQKVVGVIQDITARKQAEAALKNYSLHLEDMVEARAKELHDVQQQLIRREKLAVLGQMAGSVGHELRTPLATISNAVYYLNMVLSQADEAPRQGAAMQQDAAMREYLDIIATEVRNAEKIITDLLDFARIKSLERQHVHLADLVALALAKQAPPANIQVITDIPADLLPLFVDPTHLEQVLHNLIANACQAMPTGGVLTIRAVAETSQITLSVIDTGCGIAEKYLEKIFEPLFTTKTKGIGLGLAVSKNLIAANGGLITVQSREREGTVFTVSFPPRKKVATD